MAKDFYSVLGVSRNATQQEIKKAYRKLAHEHHPDKATGNEERFKEVNTAYQTLGDEKKRAKYDQIGHSGYTSGQQGGFGGGFNWQDFSSGGASQGWSGFGFDRNSGIEFDLGDIFETFFGGGARNRGPRPRRGADLEVRMDLDFREAVFGTEKNIKVRRSVPSGDGTRSIEEKTVRVTIPAGIDDGQSIKLSGQGEKGVYGGPTGDLYVSIHVLPSKYFTRKEDHILTTADITFAQAALGDKIEIETLDGFFSVKIAPGTEGGTIMKLSGKGVPHLRRSGRGDHLLKINVKVPKKLSRKAKKLIEELEKEGV